MLSLWSANVRYVEAVEKYFAGNALVNGEILVYGHLNPYGVDPHNRITFASNNQQACERAMEKIEEMTNSFLRDVAIICADTGAVFIGGEKGAGSEAEFHRAFTDKAPDFNHYPKDLKSKIQSQRAAVQQASSRFSWRALAPYGS